MREDIISNLKIFSELTQSTLSAFHISGVNNEIYEEIEVLKRFIQKSRQKTLLKIEKVNNDKYKRYFTDNTTDIVEECEVRNPVYYEETNINKILSIKPNPIISIRLGNIQDVQNKTPDSLIEKMFLPDCKS